MINENFLRTDEILFHNLQTYRRILTCTYQCTSSERTYKKSL